MSNCAPRVQKRSNPEGARPAPDPCGPAVGWKGQLQQSLKGLSYNQQQARLKPATPALPLLRRGSRGKAVNDLQTALNLWGSQSTLPGKTALAVDGIFGANTDARVRAFQREEGISIDGIVGPDTRGRLQARRGRVASAAMTGNEKKTLAESLIVIAGTAGAADKTVVVAEMLVMPQAALEVLKDEGARVWVCQGSVTQVRTDLAGVRPRGWPAGKTWDTVPGLYDPGGNRTIIATRGGRVPPTGDGHGASNLVVHEVMHAVDHNTSASDSPAFVRSRKADESTLTAYQTQAGAAGREETWAEHAAHYYGGTANHATNHPNLNEYYRNNPVEAQIFAEIREAAKAGKGAQYVIDTIKSRHLRRANTTEKAAMLVNLLAGRPLNTARALEILKAGAASGTLAAVDRQGRLYHLLSAFSGAALRELYTIDAPQIRAHRAGVCPG